jgi:hypothetical protein
MRGIRTIPEAKENHPMSTRFIPVAALCLGFIPAAVLAAGQQGATGQNAASGSQATASPGAMHSPETAKQVESSLKQAGFQNVQVVDAAYVVHANAQDGSFVTMMIDPPNSTGTTAKQSAATGQQKIRASLEQAGFKNVAIVDASYLARAQTKGGDQVVMMIDPASTGRSGSSSSASPSGAQTSGGANATSQSK